MGNLSSCHSEGRVLMRREYDYRGRPVMEQGPSARPLQYEYDLLDRVRRIYRPDGNIIDIGYDCYDSVTEVKDKDRHVSTSNKGLQGIKESMVIKAGDQNAVFATRAKGKPLSKTDAAAKFKIKETHARNYIDFDIDDSRVEYRKNNLGVEEYKIKGDIELDLETTDFVKRCQ